MTDRRPTAKKLIREVWRQMTDGKESVDLATEARRITDGLMRNDAFVRTFAEDFLYDSVYECGEHILMTQKRQSVHRMGTRVATREAIVREVQQEIEAGFAAWMEYDPTTKRNFALTEMTKHQVLAAAELRLARAMGDLRKAEWLRLIANGMEDGQTVGEVWTDQELKDLQESLDVKISTSIKQTLGRSAAA